MKPDGMRIEWFFIAAAVLVATAAGSIVFVVKQIHTLGGARNASHWIATQTETDYLRLSKDLELYIAGAPSVSHGDVRRRLDLFYARFDTLTSPEASGLMTLSSHGSIVDQLASMAAELDMLTKRPDFRDGAEAQRAVAAMQDVWLPLHGWVREVVSGELLMDERLGLQQDQRLILFSNIVLLIVSVVVIYGLYRRSLANRALALAERKTRIKAELASSAQDRFIAAMSHELRTPLNAIVGFSDLLASELPGEMNERQREYIRDIASSGRVLLGVIGDILDYSKLEAKMHEPQIETEDLCEIVEVAARMLKPTFVADGGEVAVDAPDRPVAIRTDMRFALQSITNLMANAAKFSPQDGVIEVAVRRDGDAGVVAIRDHGPGMTEAEIEQSFQPFKQFQDPYVANQSGTGLGLTLTRSFCEIMGARLTLRPAIGGGLEAEIRFPTRVGAPSDVVSDAPVDTRDRAA